MPVGFLWLRTYSFGLCDPIHTSYAPERNPVLRIRRLFLAHELAFTRLFKPRPDVYFSNPFMKYPIASSKSCGSGSVSPISNSVRRSRSIAERSRPWRST